MPFDLTDEQRLRLQAVRDAVKTSDILIRHAEADAAPAERGRP